MSAPRTKPLVWICPIVYKVATPARKNERGGNVGLASDSWPSGAEVLRHVHFILSVN